MTPGILDYILGFVIGALLAVIACLLGFTPGQIIAACLGAAALLVILPCAFAGLFIDLDTYKDPRQQ